MHKLIPTLSNRFVGFDQFFNEIEQALTTVHKATTFPAYDIVKTDTGFTIEMAVAGYTKSDIEVTLNSKNHVLTVKGTKSAEKANRVYTGIASRNFTRSWTLNPDMEVTNCAVKDGILTIDLSEAQKAEEVRVIEIA